MRKKEVIISNDKKDRHGDTMTLSALKQAKDITNSQIISGYKEHDFRNPPICRTTKAYILNHEGTNWLRRNGDL